MNAGNVMANVGNNVVGVWNIVMNIGNNGMLLCCVLMSVRAGYMCVYLKFSLEMRGQ